MNRPLTAALPLCLLSACGGDASTASSTEGFVSVPAAIDPGTVVFLKVTDERDRMPPVYRSGHAMRLSVTVAPDEAYQDDIGDIILNVGLVQAVDTEAEQETATTCYLRQLNADTAEVSIDDETGYVTFVADTVIPSECVHGLPPRERRTMNVWVSMNAPTEDAVPEGEALDPNDYNTQFFTRFEEDLGADGNRNRLCETEDRQGHRVSSCVLDLDVAGSPGYNVEVDELDLESTLFIVADDVCTRPIDYSEPGLEAAVELKIWGNDPHPPRARDLSLTNALEDATRGMQGNVNISASMCPARDAESCVEGTDYLPLFVTRKEDDAVPTGATAVASIPVAKMVVGEPLEYSFDTHLEPSSETCRAITGAPAPGEADWGDYSTFLVRYCILAPFPESGPKGNEDRDNCETKLVKLVLDPVATGDARSLEFNKTWTKEVGNSVVSGLADFGTENRLDTSGVRAYTYATAGVGGWLNVTIVDAEVEGLANTSILGSAVSTHVDVFGSRLYSFTDSVPTAASRTLTLSGDRSFAKSRCVTYNYGLAGVGFTATICAQGSAGMNYQSTVTLTAQSSAPMAQGSIGGTVSPFVAMDLSARASVNAVVTRGSIQGDLDLVDVSLPTGPALVFEKQALSDTDVDVRWDVGSDLAVTFLDGSITAWVDLLKPAWCKKKKFGVKIKYPCDEWKEVAKTNLVDFNGFRYAIELLNVDGSSTLTP